MNKWGKINIILVIVVFMNAFNIFFASDVVAKLNTQKLTIYIGNTKQLKMTGTKKKIKWTSNKKKIATVTKTGKVKGVKAGKATITAKIGTKKYSCTVTVKDIVINKTSTQLKVGKSINLKVLGNKKKTIWFSDDAGIAAVDKNGVVTAVNQGVTIINAKTGGKLYCCVVVVKKNDEMVTPSYHTTVTPKVTDSIGEISNTTSPLTTEMPTESDVFFEKTIQPSGTECPAGTKCPLETTIVPTAFATIIPSEPTIMKTAIPPETAIMETAVPQETSVGQTTILPEPTVPKLTVTETIVPSETMEIIKTMVPERTIAPVETKMTSCPVETVFPLITAIPNDATHPVATTKPKSTPVNTVTPKNPYLTKTLYTSKEENIGQINFVLPKTWTNQTKDKNSAYQAYFPKRGEKAITSGVLVGVWEKGGLSEETLEQFIHNKADMEMEKMKNAGWKNVSVDISSSKMEIGSAVISFWQFSEDNKFQTMLVYDIIIDNYLVEVEIGDVKDNIEPNIYEVGRNIINSLRITN